MSASGTTNYEGGGVCSNKLCGLLDRFLAYIRAKEKYTTNQHLHLHLR